MRINKEAVIIEKESIVYSVFSQILRVLEDNITEIKGGKIAMELYKSCQINRWVFRPKTLNINDGIDYKRASILKIEIRNAWYNFNKLIIKMDGLSALVWSKKTFSELELNWDGSSSSRD